MQRVILILMFATSASAADCSAIFTLSCPGATAGLSTASCAASDGSYFDLWQFSGTAGQSVSIDMTSSSFDAFLILLDPNGKPVADNDDIASGNTNSRITFTLTSSGTWTVAANALKANQFGTYTITLGGCATTIAPRRRAATH